MDRFCLPWKKVIVLAACLFMSGCVSPKKNISLILDTKTKEELNREGPEIYLSRIDEFLAREPEKKDLIKDVWLMLQAQVKESSGSIEDAGKLWLESIKISNGEFGNIALQGWLRVNRKILGQNASTEVLARLLLVQVEKSHAPYLKKENLFDLPALKKKIESEADSAGDENFKKKDELVPPTMGVWPFEDPLLQSTLERLCKRKTEDAIPAAWNEWASSLPPTRRSYFLGMMFGCMGHDQRAIEQLKNAIALLEGDKTKNLLALEAADTLAIIMRRTGRRTEAADVYMKVLSLYASGTNNYSNYKLSEISYFNKRIDRYLWAARSRALIGDYLTAKNIVHEAFGLVSKAQIIPNLKAIDKEMLIGFRAEGYHVLASRIAIEQGDYTAAVNINKIALQMPNLKPTWIERFRWYQGLYSYIAGNKIDAISIWRVLYEETLDVQVKEKTGFWLARTYFETGNKKAFEEYRKKLVLHFPFGFYAIVGFKAANMPENNEWKVKLNDVQNINNGLKENSNSQIEDMRSQQELGVNLSRTEVLVQNKLGKWADLAIKNLHKNISAKYPIKGNVPKFVYLIKMYYIMGSYDRAIALIDNVISEQEGFWDLYPEMIHIYYPLPYRDMFKQYAFENYLDIELLLAIAHVESRFVVNAKSGAGAKGLMQIIEPTAQRYISSLKVKEDLKALDLNDPQTNIAISAAYLRYLNAHYRSKSPYIIGAYNAGESIVDRWLEARHPEDLMTWLELIPFKETNEYIKNVWVGLPIYQEITRDR